MASCARALTPLLLFLTAGCSPEPEAPAPREPASLLLISVDTLRADHVGVYGHPRPTSPTLDELAREGVRFADATVQWPKTWPSMASMLTGTYPATNGVRLRSKRLAARNETLAEMLGKAGFRTGAVVSNFNLGAQFGFDQGFDSFVESWVEALQRQTGETELANHPGAVKRYTNARTVTDQGLRFLDALAPDEPFFLWLHYMEPHGPYQPPSELEALFQGSYPSEPVPWREIPPYQRHYDADGLVEEDLGRYKARYDAEIRVFDGELARLRSALAGRRLDGRTLLVVTSDHGESLSDQGYYLEHGQLPWQSTAAVPLVLWFPQRLPAGSVVETPVGLLGLAPTLLEILGVAVPAGVEGRSLLGLIQGREPSEPDDVFMESGYSEPSQLVVRRGRWKLVRFRAADEQTAAGGSAQALFDLEADPGEQHDVLGEHPEVAASLAEALDGFVASQPEPDDAADMPARTVDPTTRRMLEALGYAGEAGGETPPARNAPLE